MGLLQAISGLNAAHDAMNIISNNIANASTMGFKEQNIFFTDLVDRQNHQNKTQGMGVGILKITQNLYPGKMIHTNNNMDLTITNNGFFRLTTPDGNILYTKNGHFKVDKNHEIVNEEGMYLTGYSDLDAAIKNNYNQLPQKLPIKTEIPTKPTSIVKIYSILNNNNVILNKKFDQKISNTFNHKSRISIYDERGKKHFIDLFFIKTADKMWNIFPYNATNNTILQPIKVEFNKSGNIISKNTNINILYNKKNKKDHFLLNLSKLSEQEIPNNTCIDQYTQNGYSSGKLETYEINDKGTVFGIYSNQKRIILSHITLSNFSNAENLHYEGNNTWSKTNYSGIETIGIPGMEGFKKLKVGALEQSNVDVNKEFIKMIMAQRNYQSNSQIIKTEEKMFDALMNL